MQQHPSMPGHVCVYSSSHDSVGISFYGEFDISNAHQMADCVGDAARSGDWRHIEFDLSRVAFLGVAPVAALMQFAADANAAGCRVTITATSRQAQRTLHLAGASESIASLASAAR